MNRDHEESSLDRATIRRGPAPAEAPPSAAPTPLHSRVGNRAFREIVQRATMKTQGAGPLDPEIGEEIRSAQGGGRALDDATRVDMESHLGVDLSAVRVHDDANADALNRSVQAEAFTTGTDVFFKSGAFSPGSSDGRRLLAHELTHVVQQSSGMTDGAGEVSHPDDPHEVEARSVGDAVAASPVGTLDRSAESVEGEAGPELQRQEEEEEELQLSVQREELDEDVQLKASDQQVSRQEEEEEELQM